MSPRINVEHLNGIRLKRHRLLSQLADYDQKCILFNPNGAGKGATPPPPFTTTSKSGVFHVLWVVGGGVIHQWAWKVAGFRLNYSH